MMLLKEMNLFFLFSKQVQDCWFSRGGMWEIQWTDFVSWCSPTQNREIVPGSVQSMQLNFGRKRNNSNFLRRNSSYLFLQCPQYSGQAAFTQRSMATRESRYWSHSDLCIHILGHQYWCNSLWQSRFILPAKCILTFYPLLFFKLKGS